MMKHYHLYGCMEDVCYRLPVMETKDKVLWSEEFPSDTRASVLPEAKTFLMHINVNSSDFTKPITNKDYCEEILTWAEETKLDHIVDLRDTFKIEMDYMIYTGTNVMIYEGTSCWSVKGKEILVPSPVDEESQELSYRKAIRFEKTISALEKAFSGSYGLMHCHCREEYYLLIKGIRIKGISDEGFVDPKPEFLSSVIDLSGRRRYIPTVPSEIAILLFDTDTYGIDFRPEKIPFRPKKLDVELNIVLNNFCEFGDETKLLEIVYKNNGSASSETEDPRFPCHPNIHPHPGVYIPHPVRPICPMHPPISLVPPVPDKPDENPGDTTDPENPDTPPTNDENPVEPPTDGDQTGGDEENPDVPKEPGEGDSSEPPIDNSGTDESGSVNPPDVSEKPGTESDLDTEVV